MSNNTVGEEKSHGADGAGFDSCYETCLFSFFFFSLLVNTSFFYCNIFYKINTAATCIHRLPLPHISLIVYLTIAWVRAYWNLRNEMERNEVKICSLRNENL